MTLLFHRSTLIFLLTAPFAAFHAHAQSVVIERAPESAQPPSAEDTAALRAENQRLARELDSTRHAVERLTRDLSGAQSDRTESERALAESARELATLRARLARSESQPAPAPNPELQQNLTHAQNVANELAAKNQQLDTTVAQLTADLRAAQTTLAATEKRLTESSAATASNTATTARLDTLTADTARLQQEKSDLEIQLAESRASETALRQQLATPPPTATPLPDTPPSPDLSDRLNETENKLSTVLRSFSLLQEENQRLKSSTTDAASLQSDLQAARDQIATLEAKVSELSSAEIPPEFADRLAAAEDKLSTTLRSFSLLQTENNRLKNDSATAIESARTAAATSANESAAQISALFDELRQARAQIAALSAENSQLKTRAALSGPAPGSTYASPSRPRAALPNPPPQTTPIENPLPSTDTAPPSTSGRTHTVAPGDTLGQISRQYYGTPHRWEEILRANPDAVQNENALPIGVTLQIP